MPRHVGDAPANDECDIGLAPLLPIVSYHAMERWHAERILLITHFGCAWYGHRLQRSPTACLAAQTEDVEAAAATLERWYPGMRVDAYLAMRQHEWVSFHQLDI